MSRYRKIETKMWGDAKFRSFPQNTQYLWIYLLTNPETTSLPGLYSCGKMAMVESLGWSMESFLESFEELSRNDMVKADWDARLIWIPKSIIYNRPQNPNVVKSWSAHWNDLPECPLKVEAYQAFKIRMESLGESYLKSFLESFGESIPESVAGAGAGPEAGAGAGAGPEAGAEAGAGPEAGAEAGNSKGPAKKSGVRLPKNFEIPGNVKTWVKTKFPGITASAINFEFEKFCNYFHSATGQNASKSEWDKTLMNWFLTASGRRDSPLFGKHVDSLTKQNQNRPEEISQNQAITDMLDKQENDGGPSHSRRGGREQG